MLIVADGGNVIIFEKSLDFNTLCLCPQNEAVLAAKL